MMMKRALMTVAVVGALAATGAPANAADDVRIATLPGTGWQVTSTAPVGMAWTSVGFDASSWSEPTVLTGLEALLGVTPTIAPLVVGAPAARPMWSNGAAVDGTGGPDHIYMRNEFSLAGFSIGQALNTLAKIQVDDDFVYMSMATKFWLIRTMALPALSMRRASVLIFMLAKPTSLPLRRSTVAGATRVTEAIRM